MVEQPQADQPFDRIHPIAPGNDGAQRRAVVGGERIAVHPVGEQRIRMQRSLPGKAPGKSDRQLAAGDHALVGALEEQFPGRGARPGERQHIRQRDPLPLGAAHRAVLPGDARRPRLEFGPPVPRALERGYPPLPRQRLQVRQTQGERALYFAVHDQPPRGGIAFRDEVLDDLADNQELRSHRARAAYMRGPSKGPGERPGPSRRWRGPPFPRGRITTFRPSPKPVDAVMTLGSSASAM